MALDHLVSHRLLWSPMVDRDRKSMQNVAERAGPRVCVPRNGLGASGDPASTASSMDVTFSTHLLQENGAARRRHQMLCNL
ncbi:hypothetical protein CABS01_10758 [Colletotrichum abscissum]|uniref:Uncharacterized protein n=3 Tax=Colletotrichum acutatum species complex TaxID=2707335 RepID=A0A9P9XQA7_9PEZI|nr:uncharacterized protein CCOS01_08925 [Colletotrichum costaricense]XP_060379181.1 uncharacterized protein CTAM01_10220 [Colletotrichum tamarilloi]XP_060398837.1 uncharacterized protein CABS01_10758 [Colletotrichum abscissum]KAI3543307.1 hypothetical protein CSPX01_06303 [Colletotrichum filicis]KAI3557382.1 hypothetical protein CABS02_02486 [Colletotrichum abscissum]KAK1491897.1 hypothetical protein CTAM01_10220 [Colletotrichum tamarilloi]KAK1497780.1 hypothetical protein CABS01_10758 [Colle